MSTEQDDTDVELMFDSAPVDTRGLINPGPSERGSHRLANASKCLRLFGMAKTAPNNPTPAMQKGTLLHTGLAHMLALKAIAEDGIAMVAGKAYRKAEDLYTPAGAVRELAGQMGEHMYSEGRNVIDTLEAYKARWGKHTGWKVMGIEEEYRMSLPGLPPERSLYTQRADVIVEERATKHIQIVDHKSTYAILAKTANQHTMHRQFLGYQSIGRRMYGHRFGGVILNRIQIAKEGQPAKFDISKVESAPVAIKDFVRDVVLWERIIQQWEESGVPPEKWPAAFHESICISPYGPCQFYKHCHGGK